MTEKNQQEARLIADAAALFPAAKAALLELLAIPSVEGEAQNNAPFGTEVAKALQKTADLAEKLGLKPTLTPYYLTVDMDGDTTDGADALGILSHIDVVPFGEGWHFSPCGEAVGGKIYGRGSLDDKGPTVAALFAMSALKQAKAALDRPVRMIIGGNEESGCRCIKQYAAEHPAPAFGFSPDAHFPVIFAEKGIVLLTAGLQSAPGKLQSVEAGTVVNAVPGKAQAILRDIDHETAKQLLTRDFAGELAEGKLQITPTDEAEIKLTALGKAAHGSQPEKGVNAAWLLLKALLALPLAEEEAAACRTLSLLLGSDHQGRGIGVACKDEISGGLTLNLGTLHMQAGEWRVGLDMRYPVSAPFAEIWDKLTANAAANDLTLHIDEHKEPLYVPSDAQPAAELLALYREYEPGAEALAIGGGTYCRAFKNFVAFGPLRPATADLMHQADEYITEEDLRFLLEIYTRAIWRLAGKACE